MNTARREHVAVLLHQRNGEVFGWINQVDEMVRDLAPHLPSRLCRADVHLAIDLHRIHRDDFTAPVPCQPERNIGLAGSCGTDDGDDVQLTTFPRR
jgi:hypothetical protein